MLTFMMRPALKKLALVLSAAPSIALLSCHNAGGRNFLKTRTSIDIPDSPICGAAVVDADSCRPGDFGGGKWEKDLNFPPFTLSNGGRGRSDPDRVATEVRAYYLGSPYYDGDVHPYCKRNITTGLFRPDASDIFPPDSTVLQEYNLAALIDDRAIKPITTRLHNALRQTNPDEANGVTARFYDRLKEEVGDRVQARIIWFVSRYPGGVADMARNEQLRRCLQEARDHDAPVVSGIAGYLVLDNRIDDSVSSREVLYRALDRATAGYDELALDGGIKHDLGNEWSDRVSEIANIKMARQDLTSTAWPMWVQLE